MGNPISELVHVVVRLECVDALGNISTGSGYFFRFCESQDGEPVVCIVTNKHVVKNAVKGVFHLTLKNADGGPAVGTHEAVELFDLQKWVINHPVISIDLVAIPLAPVLQRANNARKQFYFLTLGKQDIADVELLQSLSPMEDIVMLGYPIGLWDTMHNMPIIRRGVTATHAGLPLSGKPEFLIDAACFPGSSGSPVFLSNLGSFLAPGGGIALGSRIAILGTLYAGPQFATEGKVITVTVPTDTKAFAVGKIPMNLGYVIRAAELLILDEEVRKRNVPPQAANLSRNSRCSCLSGKRYKDCCGRLA